MYVYARFEYLVPMDNRRKHQVSGHLELKLGRIVSHIMTAENRLWVLENSSQCSQCWEQSLGPLEHQPVLSMMRTEPGSSRTVASAPNAENRAWVLYNSSQCSQKLCRLSCHMMEILNNVSQLFLIFKCSVYFHALLLVMLSVYLIFKFFF